MAGVQTVRTKPATTDKAVSWDGAKDDPLLRKDVVELNGQPPPSVWERLRAPFPAEKVGKLPRATVDRETYRALKKERCDQCGGWHPKDKTIHLDYVGHADVTDRLLEVDPEWNWEPVAWDETTKLPRFTLSNGRPVGLWIKLSVCGVTRLGYGSCDASKGDAEKELIGDALRNAALRFGVALDLWRKERPPVEEDDRPSERPAPPASAQAPVQSTPTASGWTDPQRKYLTALKESLPQQMTPFIWEGIEKLTYELAKAALSRRHEQECWKDEQAKRTCINTHLGVASANS